MPSARSSSRSPPRFGGGTVRDVLLDRRPFYWVEHEYYVLLIFAMSIGAAIVFRVVSTVASDRAMLVADAVGLGLFSVTGTSLALVAQMTPTVAVMMGIISAVFGGVVRDVLCNEVPMILRDRSPYATCSFVGCWVYVGLTWLRADQEAALLTGALVTMAMRLLSVQLGWKLPSWQIPQKREKPALGRLFHFRLTDDFRSDCGFVLLAGTDADHAFDLGHEDLAVTDLARVGGLHDRIQHGVELVLGHDDFDLDLRQEIDHILGAAIQLGVALLAAEALYLGHGEAGHAHIRQRLAYLVELERFDDGGNLLHGWPLSVFVVEDDRF